MVRYFGQNLPLGENVVSKRRPRDVLTEREIEICRKGGKREKEAFPFSALGARRQKEARVGIERGTDELT